MSVVLVLFLLGMNAKFLFPGFLKGRKKRYFKESFSAFGEGNALLFWFCSIQQGSMKGLKKKGPTKVVGVHWSYPRLRFQ